MYRDCSISITLLYIFSLIDFDSTLSKYIYIYMHYANEWCVHSTQ